MMTFKVELHCHTYHSGDSLMLPEQIVKLCSQRKLDRIAITDHNTIAGALETSKLAPKRVIIGEEILTTEGEILGYFMTQEVPAGLAPMEVINRLKEQGAVISISHPFDRTRSANWKDETLTALVPELDMIEVLNARTWTDHPNLEAAELAKRAGLPGVAGSDAHAPLEVGRATLILPAFEDAASFRAALQNSHIEGRRSIPLVHLTSRYAVWRKKRGWERP
jgi:predicted metal-dependent phosphoesterase TrpH